MTPDPRTVSEHARSAILDPDRIRVVVTLPTFRRPDHLVMTLDSLEAQAFGDETAVVVMDNDADGLQGANAAAEWLRGSRLKGIVIVAHQRGNCHAYNAGWETALAEFPRLTHIAVIDDDEIAGPEWLSGLMKTAQKTGADLVGGPQIPVFADRKLDGWRRHPVFTPHYHETGLVPILYSSGNVLISRPVLDMMPRPFLDPAFNFIGGGDSDFYRRARARGFSFGWSAEAAVMETLPSRRAEFSWLNAGR
jgi:GT2 family glycosyltransferase